MQAQLKRHLAGRFMTKLLATLALAVGFTTAATAANDMLYRMALDGNADKSGTGTQSVTTSGTASPVWETNTKKFGTGSFKVSNAMAYVIDNIETTKAEGWTLSFWFHPNGMASWKDVLAFAIGSKVGKFEKNGSNELCIYRASSDVADQIQPEDNPVLSYVNNAWNHIALVSTSTGFDVYLNGAKSKSVTQEFDSGLTKIFIGNAGFYEARTSSALVDEVAVFNYPMTQTQIFALAQAQADEVAESGVAKWGNLGTKANQGVAWSSVDRMGMAKSYSISFKDDSNLCHIGIGSGGKLKVTEFKLALADSNPSAPASVSLSDGTVTVTSSSSTTASETVYRDTGSLTRNVATFAFTSTDTLDTTKTITLTMTGDWRGTCVKPINATTKTGDWSPVYLLKGTYVPGTLSMNFASGSGSASADSGILASARWNNWGNANDAQSGTASDGTQTFNTKWSCANGWSYTDGVTDNILKGYLDDGGNGIKIEVSRIPYEYYDVVYYMATDSGGYKFNPPSLNGLFYSWDGTANSTTRNDTALKFGLSQTKTAALGTNVGYVKKAFSGKLDVYGGGNANTARGGIAALQVVERVSQICRATVTANCNWSDIVWTPAIDPAAKLQLTVQNNAVITMDNTATYRALAVSGATTFKYTDQPTADQIAAAMGAKVSVVRPAVAKTVTGSVTYEKTAYPVAGCDIVAGAAGLTVVANAKLSNRTLNINFAGGRSGNKLIDDSRLNYGDRATALHGGYPVLGSKWNDVAAGNDTVAGLTAYDADGNALALAVAPTVTVSKVANPYTTGRTGGDRLLYGYCDDGSDGPTAVIRNIPFAKYRIYAYFSTDSQNSNLGYLNVTAGGTTTSYCGSTFDGTAGTTVKGTAAWGKSSNGGNVRNLDESVNYLVTDVMTASEVTLEGKKAPSSRAGVAGYQIVDCSDEGRAVAAYVANVTVDTDWSDIVWTGTGDAYYLTIAAGKTVTIDSPVALDKPLYVVGGTLAAGAGVFENVCLGKPILTGSAFGTWEGTALADVAVAGYEDYKLQFTENGVLLCGVKDTEVLSVNVAGGNGNGTVTDASYLADGDDALGLATVPGSSWNNIAEKWNADAAKTLAAGEVYAQGANGVKTLRGIVSVTAGAHNTYAYGATTSFLKGYLDDGAYEGGNAVITVTDLPYSEYDLIVYAATDNGTVFRAVSVNGKSYTWSNGATVEGSADWGKTLAGTPAYGQNALVIRGLTVSTLTVRGGAGGDGKRGGLAAIQIVNRGTISERHTYVKTLNGDAVFGEIDWGTTFVAGGLTAVTITNEAESSVLTLDNPTIQLESLKIVSAGDVRINASVYPSNIASLDLTEVAGKIVYGYPVAALATTADNVAYAGGTSTRVGIVHGAAGTRLDLVGGTYELSETHGDNETTVSVTDSVLNYGDAMALGKGAYAIGGTSEVNAVKFVLVQGAGNDCSFTLSDDATVNVSSTTTEDSNQNAVLFGHWGGNSTFTIEDQAAFTATGSQILVGKTGGNHTVNVNGGTITAKGIKASGNASGTNVLNLNGGSLMLGENGISSYNANRTIAVNVKGDSVIASTAAMPITQSVTVDADQTLTLDATAGMITLSGAIANSGTIEVAGGVVKFGEEEPGAVTVTGGEAIFSVYRGAVTVEDGAVGYVVGINDNNQFAVPAGMDATKVNLYTVGGTKLEVTVDGQKLTFEYPMYGASCLMEYLFKGNLNSTGSDTGALQFDGTHCFSGYEYVTNAAGEKVGGIYAASAPWRNVTFPSDVTVVMYGKVMKTSNACQIGIGSTTAGSKYSLFLASGDVSKEEVVLGFANTTTCYQDASKFGVLCRMTVPHAQTADHLYAFTLTQQGSKTLVKIYLDGELLQPYEFASTVTLGGGIQLGSIHGGIGGSQDWPEAFGFKRSTAAETDATLNFLRVYDGVLNDTVMRSIATDYPYESPAGSFNRTFAGHADWTSADAWTKVGEETKYDAPENGSAVTVTPPATDMTLTVNVDEAVSFEAFTANVGGKITVVKASDAAGSLNVAGRSTISTDMQVDIAALTFGGNVAVAAGKTLTFDCGSIDLSKYYADTDVKLTGVPTLGDGATVQAINVPTYAGRTAAFMYDSSKQQYVVRISVKGELKAVLATGAAKFSELVWKMGDDTVTPDWELVRAAKLEPADGVTLELDTALGYAVTLTTTNSLEVFKSIDAAANVTLTPAAGQMISVYAAPDTMVEGLPCTINGTLGKTGEGTFLAAVNRAIVVKEGTLKAGSAGTASVTVEEGATFDVNGLGGSIYTVTLNGGALVNNGAKIGDAKQVTALTLGADSTIGGTGGFSIQGTADNQYGATSVNLGAFTLTKTGTNALALVNTTISGSGTLRVEEGLLNSTETTTFNGPTLVIGAQGEVRNRSDKTLTAAKIAGEGGLLANEGALGDFTLTGSIKLANAGTYGVITLQSGATPDIGNKRGLFIRGDGTVTAVLTGDEYAGLRGASVTPVTLFTVPSGSVKPTVVVKHNGGNITARCVFDETGTTITGLRFPTVLILR